MIDTDEPLFNSYLKRESIKDWVWPDWFNSWLENRNHEKDFENFVLSHNWVWELQNIYDSEINFSISTFWDWWFDVMLWDNTNWIKCSSNEETIDKAIYFLVCSCQEYYPGSKYVKDLKNK